MSWKEKLTKIMDEMTDGYMRFKNAKTRFIHDLNDIFQYAATLVNKMDYINYTNKFSTSVDFSGRKSEIMLGIRSIHADLNKLERTILNYDKASSDDNAYENINSSEKVAPDVKVSNTYTPDIFSKIIDRKNKYFWKTETQLQDVIRVETGIKVNDISSLLKDAMGLKVTDPKYSGIARINYDSRIASQEMKEDFIRAYTSKDLTLKEISIEFEKKYGMYISISTISRKARNYLCDHGLNFKNRREAKKHYQDKNTK